ncbi:ABC-type nitrate/sulfonate/bicarbonate transport system substrate-binding protein [Beijerinckia sp. GAS462]|nr:ABC-type nitrate/sulfonate/bicarbonate transport system substrate-binding protein [Beijerinckia sp. GAS462]SEC15543.1 ABC-type nitrate/sulfonate/bicarbonate transport system, substrate-binding protein [Beijerinckia sp. 28-YEA-48]
MPVDRLVVSTFPNAKALPLWAGVEQGIFAARSLDLAVHETGSSREQREGLASGSIDIVQAAIDNALAMIKAGHDVVILMGGEGGMNDFIVRQDIRSPRDLRGRVLAVDSPDTAYALLLRKVLAAHGLRYGHDYELRAVGNGGKRLRALAKDRQLAGAILNPPFSAEAILGGMHSLGRLDDLVGPYQAGGAFAQRSFAQKSGSLIERYVQGYVAALDWLREPGNAATAQRLLRERLAIAGDVAEATYRRLCDPASGFAPQARLNWAGFRAMLDVRAETEGRDAKFEDTKAYVDETYYERAIARITNETSVP